MFNFMNKQNRSAPKQAAFHEVIGGCGKMPMHADFIKHNVKVREAVALDDWIQGGVTLLNRRYEEKWKRVFDLSPNFRFGFIGDDNDKTISGVIAPSRNKIGRCYPFVLFRATDNVIFKQHQSLLPMMLSDSYTTMDQLFKVPWQDKALDTFLQAIDSTPAFHIDFNDKDWLSHALTVLENTSIDDLWHDILPGASESIRVAFMYVVISSLQTVARRSPQKVHWGLRLPLPSGSQANLHVMFWVKLAETVLRDRSWRANFLWNPAVPGIPARLLLFFHQIPSSYFTLLIDSRRTDDTVMDVLQEIETVNVDPLQLTKYHFPGDMSLQQVLDEVMNQGTGL